MRPLAVAVAALLSVLGMSVAAAIPPIGPPATVERSADRLDPPRPVLLVSDSAWLGMKIYGAIDAVQGFDHVLDLASCRRRVTSSCTNFDGFVPITLLEELDEWGDNYHTLIVATGYNDSDHDFEPDVRRIVGRAGELGYERIVWLTLRSNVSYTSPGSAGHGAVYARNNATLADLVASGEFPDLVVADWAAYARDRPEWFSADGIHLRNDGPWAAADYVSRKVAFLDGRACPQPIVSGATAHDPCPDPDAAPPSVDLASVYPLGTPNPTAGFTLEWQRAGVWPAPPWWER